ncbi:MAG TPA: protein kinase, partial [Gemmatales bacterium]|nr:protein kinase [Gemmatales bacterium]
MNTTLEAGSFLHCLQKSKLIDADKLQELLDNFPGDREDGQALSSYLLKKELLTEFQVKALLQGRYKGLRVGPYNILNKLGSGGMGIVYLAEHQKMRRKVALKILPEERTKDKLALERFYREARSVAELDHPNIVKAHDVNEYHGIHYLVMEYISGVTLLRYVEKKGRMSWKMAMNIMVQVCRGLQHAHEKGLVHRDIKPANLLIDKTGQVKILDLGLARSLEKQHDNLTADLSNGKDIQGSIDYVSPEQAFGKPVDIRCDIYSLGATIYTVIVGKPIVEGTPANKLLQHQLQVPKPLHLVNREIPEQFSVVIQTMLEKNPHDRYSTPADVIQALKPLFTAPANNVTHEEIPTAIALPDAPVHSGELSRPSALESTLEMEAGKTKVIRKKGKKFKKKKTKRQLAPWIALACVLTVLGGMAWATYSLITSLSSNKPLAITTSLTKTPAVQNNNNPSQAIGDLPPAAGQPVAQNYSLQEGNKLPDIVGEDLEGSNFRLSDYEGKVILLDFWGYWCPHCVKLIPHENKLVNLYKNRPFALLGINNDKDDATIQNGMKRNPVFFRSFRDKLPDGKQFSKLCGVKGFPTLVLLDHHG